MRAQDTLRTINCTACGAGLTVLGGGRVRAQVCDYCGSTLDVQDAYKVLERMRRPDAVNTPFDLGATGTIYGVEFTIIGALAVEEHWDGESWRWVEHQVFSPTHGYAWLTLEDSGHLTFTRKVRGIGNNGWYTHTRVNIAENKPALWWGERRFAYYESGTKTVTQAVGSFNYVPKRGETVDYVSFLGATEMFTQAASETEREVELTSLLPFAETAAAFGAPDLATPRGVHPTEPYAPWRHARFARNTGIAAGGVGLVMWLSILGAGDVILDEAAIPTVRPIELSFELTNPRDLTQIALTGNVSNSWAWYDIELVSPSGETVAEFGRQSEYYFGRTDGESWSEGTRRATARLRLEEPGTYQMFIEESEKGTWGGGRAPTQVSVTVTQGQKAGAWMLIASLMAASFGLLFPIKRWTHHNRRWAGSDWTDED